MSPANPTAKSGFTLIELLVVISVISILVAMLLPVLGRAKTQAKTIVCISNVRQLVMAAALYGDEQDDWLPYRGPESFQAPQIYYVEGTGFDYEDCRGLWVDYLPGYTSTDPGAVMYCPVSDNIVIRYNRSWPTDTWAKVYMSSYFYFGNMNSTVNGAAWMADRMPTRLGDDPSLPIFGDVTQDKSGTVIGQWRIYNHGIDEKSAEFTTVPPAGAVNGRLDGAVRFYTFPEQMEVAHLSNDALPGNYWAPPK